MVVLRDFKNFPLVDYLWNWSHRFRPARPAIKDHSTTSTRRWVRSTSSRRRGPRSGCLYIMLIHDSYIFYWFLNFVYSNSICRNGSTNSHNNKESDNNAIPWRNSSANHGLDSTLRNLIDDSVQEESTTASSAGILSVNSTSSPRQSVLTGSEAADPSNDDHSQGSSHSLSGLDSPLLPPPVRFSCIQGYVRNCHFCSSYRAKCYYFLRLLLSLHLTRLFIDVPHIEAQLKLFDWISSRSAVIYTAM